MSKCNNTCKYYKNCWSRGEGLKEDGEECARYEPDRPHGEWKHWGSPFSDDSIANSIVCSLCKARYVEIEDEVFNFCPNCGSDNRPRILDETIDGEGKDGNVREGEAE